MIRIILFLALLTAAAAGLAWFADNPGSVTVNWLDHEAETSVFQAVVMLTIAAAALWLVIAFISAIVTAPRRLSMKLQARRRDKGFKALQDGIFAVGAGDDALAARCAAIANKYAPNKPLTRLLRAQAAQLNGDRIGAQRIFASMLDDPDTKLLGLRGLYLEAKREGQMESARLYVEQALQINPALPWPSIALFEFQSQAQDWAGALSTLGIARANRIIDRATADRRRAVILTAMALESETKGDGKAMDLAVEAHRLAPDLIPAAAIAGRALAAAGATARAAKIITQTWRQTPHPDLATAYAYARPGDSPRDRLTRIRALAAETPGHPEAAAAIATAAVEAQEWAQAREALHFLLLDKPTVRVCMLMARIEAGEKRDTGRVREWLARALRAPRDPAWIADGVVSSEWAPLSPVTSTFDAFVWETPPERLKEGSADERILADLERFEPVLDDLIAGEEQTFDAVPPPPQEASRPEPVEVVAEPASQPILKPAPEIILIPKPEPEKAEPPLPSGAADPPKPTTVSMKPRQKPRPNIFVAERAPDDPGPNGHPEEGDANTPLTRFRMTVKD